MEETTIPELYPSITKHFDKYAKKMATHHSSVDAKVEALYEKFNAELAAIYQPVITACTDMKSSRDSQLSVLIEEQVYYQFKKIMENCNNYSFHTRDEKSNQTYLQKKLDVDCWGIEFDTYHPYDDSTLFKQTNMTANISVRIPSIGIHRRDSTPHCLTNEYIEREYVRQSCLAEYEYKLNRYSDEIVLNFEFVLEDCERPTLKFTTLPILQTHATWERP